jgi:hypothetical protein
MARFNVPRRALITGSSQEGENSPSSWHGETLKLILPEAVCIQKSAYNSKGFA